MLESVLMQLDFSLGGGFLSLFSFFDSHIDQPYQPGLYSSSLQLAPSVTQSCQNTNTAQDQDALITPPPELRPRNANPAPQNGDTCSQAEQSASQAIQQASQQASQSIQQASQQASQAAQQASQSASQAIQQAQNSASQSIAAASRSASSAASSASSVVASIQSSANQAISMANGSMMSAQASASSAQGDASRAVLQAGAAVAAATGSAAAAGSSFLSAAAKATQSAQASVSAIGAAAASQVSQASQQVSASQTAAVTATQAALAIVGSIIASTLITILIYFLVIRHKRLAKRRSRDQRSPGTAGGFGADPKFPVSDQVGTTVAASQSNYTGTRNDPASGSQVSSSLFPKLAKGDDSRDLRNSVVKTTSVPWNPSNPPRAPTLGSWLKLQDGVSPFGPINLPTDIKSNSPLGGQLKSPMRTMGNPKSPRPSGIPIRSPKLPDLSGSMSTSTTLQRNPSDWKPVSPPLNSDSLPQHQDLQAYRESKASVWTDDIPDDPASPPLQSPPKDPVSLTKGYRMQIPSPKGPVRNTAEWLAEQQRVQTPTSPRNSRPSFALPRNPRSQPLYPTRPGPARQIRSMQAEVGYVQGLNRFLGSNRTSTLSRVGSERSNVSTPGVGKAM